MMTTNEVIDLVDNSNDSRYCKEYLTWKKNTPLLYNLVMTHDLTWPTLTVQWLPDISRMEDRDFSMQRLIIGTQAENEQNYLIIAKATIPNEKRIFEAKHYDAERDEFGGYGLVNSQFEITIRINHDSCVNRARFMPQCPNVIATKPANADVLLFDYTQHPSKPDPTGKSKPDLVLKGHTQEGFGLSWNIKQAGLLLSSAEDGTVQLWDIAKTTKDDRVINSISQFYGHNGAVEDVCWHKFSPNIFGSVGIDGHLIIWDSRKTEPAVDVVAHKDDVLCLDFNPFSPYLLATGSEDGTVGLWDIRHMTQSLKYLQRHANTVSQVQWSPHKESLLASGSSDFRVHLWDLERYGKATNDYSSELAFIHAGHIAKVIDVNWNLNVPFTLASVSFDNILQLWQPSSF